MKCLRSRIVRWSALSVGMLLSHAFSASAQDNSLYHKEVQQNQTAAFPTDTPRAPLPRAVSSQVSQPAGDSARGPLMLADASWTYQSPADVVKKAQLNDIVKVTVSIKTQMTSQGKIDRSKQGFGDLKLTSWIKFYGGNLGENGNSYGTPEIRGDVNNQLQAKGDLETADNLKFVISCRIVDKRPNGNCVLEGTWSVRNNEENWEYSLSGEVRPEDIKPDNSVISDTIADLKVIKREAGHVRDSYRRGWALEWLDKWMPF
jgi:flagellar L-ring protein FlgH